jgi:hypothetical protein
MKTNFDGTWIKYDEKWALEVESSLEKYFCELQNIIENLIDGFSNIEHPLRNSSLILATYICVRCKWLASLIEDGMEKKLNELESN